MKETPREEMTIETSQEANRMLIRVIDNGPGIRADILPQLFQHPIGKTPGSKGLGMGLLMAQAIIQTYGGEIAVDSTAASGTTMLIRLPLEFQEVEKLSVQHTFLLIAEQEKTPSLRDWIATLTTLGELQVLRETDSVQQIQRRNYDLVIIDSTSVENEISLISQLRARQPNVNILVVTASPTWKSARDVLLSGANDYVRKALSKDDMLNTVRTILQLRQRQTAN
jgi:CheY-like chemotaxis protein